MEVFELRKVEVNRRTKEVDISLELDVDGTGNSEVETGIKFLDHILVTLAKQREI
jgi:imidazoleglycerol phosphate dehydratase HisB